MKHLLALIFTLVSISTVAAEIEKPAAKADEAKNTLQLNLGIANVYGLLGFSYERMLENNFAAQLGVGIDFIGPVNVLGGRYYGDTKSSGPDFWSKCFFLFNCDRRNFVGLAVQYAPETEITVVADDTQRNSRYNFGSRTLGVVSFGTKSIYKNGFVMDTSISYKSLMSESHIENVSGPDVQSDHDYFHGWEKGLGLGVGFGYMF